MDTNTKTEFLQDITKMIGKDCAFKCFVGSSECLKECYDSYIIALNTTARTLRNKGYESNSRYISLAYGEKYDEWYQISKFNDFPADELGNTVPYIEKNVFDENRSI